ncbi:MAG: hypothetical protein ACI97A_003786 [Planctomycetota bacterium]|jgi:hypothetical protein
MDQLHHNWIFKNRLFRHAVGSRLPQGIKKIQLAIAEIKKIGTKNQALAADGAVLFFQRISPAVEIADVTAPALIQVIDQGIKTLVPIIATAEIQMKQRKWLLKKLFEAHERDRGLVLESLTDHWGDLCASQTLAWDWADRLLPKTRPSLQPDMRLDDYFLGTTACLSAMLAAGRNKELIKLVEDQQYWRYKVWAVRAYLAEGSPKKAIRLAESGGHEQESDAEVKRMVKEIRSSMK